MSLKWLMYLVGIKVTGSMNRFRFRVEVKVDLRMNLAMSLKLKFEEMC